jgi:preprotein translocase subunit SecA
MVSDLVERTVAGTVQDRTPSEDWDWQAFDEQVADIFNVKITWDKSDRQDFDFDSLQDKLRTEVDHAYQAQTERNKPEQMLQLERMILLQMVDTHWKEHLLNMDHLKEGIGLRGYGQKNPLDEYKKEGFNLFLSMIETVKEQTASTLMRVQIVQDDEVARLEAEQRRQREKELEMAKAAGAGTENQTPKTVRRQEEKVGRNAPCPCGSGKKYKKCCGKLS